MAGHFEIDDKQFAILKDKIVVVTGCSSGIGLATTKLLLSEGAKVVGGDLNPSPLEDPNLSFQRTDVTSWADLLSLFKLAHEKHGGRIDHAFANAGIGPNAEYLDLKTDESGELVEPTNKTYDVNLRSVVNTSALALHYMRTQQPPGGSVIVTASASAFQRFVTVDYASAKHGVLGFMRGIALLLKTAGLPIRINAIAPSWTLTGLLPPGASSALGKEFQPPEAVARSVANLMVDETRNGHLIYSIGSKFREVDEAVLLKANDEIQDGTIDDNLVLERLMVLAQEQEASEGKDTD